MKETEKEMKKMDTAKKYDKKKFWERPQLVILCRSNPDEVLTLNCKTQNFTGPNSAFNQCMQSSACHAACQAQNNTS
jgi:hypothetical protein